jgi:hypothetical protein
MRSSGAGLVCFDERRPTSATYAMRGSFALVIWPNTALLNVPDGLPKLVRLKRLNRANVAAPGLCYRFRIVGGRRIGRRAAVPCLSESTAEQR